MGSTTRGIFKTWSLGLRSFGAGIAFLALLAIPVFAAGLKEGDALPDLSKFQLEGSLPDLKGKVVLIDFWASWCPPCKASFPAMDALLKKYGEKGFVVLAVNVDEDKREMDKFLKKASPTFTLVRDAQQKFVEAANVSTLPTSLLIDRTGKIRHVHSGFEGEKTTAQYEKQIEELLK